MSRRSDGKIVQEWTWKKEGFERTVQIRMTGTGTSTKFHASDTELGIRAESSSVSDVVRLLEEQFNRRFSTHWSLWLWVNVDLTDHNPCDYGIAPVLRWEPVAIGETPDGKKVHSSASIELEYLGVDSHLDAREEGGMLTKRRTWNGAWSPSAGRVSDGEPKPPHLHEYQNNGLRPHSHENKDRWVLIEGTPENIEALCIFEWDLMLLTRRIAEHFTRKKLKDTLALIAHRGGTPLLAPPKENRP